MGTAESLSLPPRAAWLSFRSSYPVVVFELFGRRDGKALAGYNLVDAQARRGSFVKRENDGWTGIAVVNGYGGPNSINLNAYNNAGKLLATQSISLEGYEKVVDVVENLFDDSVAAATYFTFSATYQLSVFQLNGSDNGLLLDALPALCNNLSCKQY